MPSLNYSLLIFFGIDRYHCRSVPGRMGRHPVSRLRWIHDGEPTILAMGFRKSYRLAQDCVSQT
jgi:hypothetical protein